LSAQHPALTRGLIEDVLVIAVDREAQTDQGRPKSTLELTLEIKAADVERFEHARQLGAISLALRPRRWQHADTQ
jgi:Flp pilus assembly protein CpaB